MAQIGQWADVIIVDSLSTGDLIAFGAIAIAAVVGVAEVIAAFIGWRVWRSPATTITPGLWKVERFSSDAVTMLFQVSGRIVFSPSGTSFMVIGARCQAKAGGKTISLEPVQAHMDVLQQGGMSLPFVFRETGDKSAISHNPMQLADVEVWLRLADGSKHYEEQKGISTGAQVIRINALALEIDRSPGQMIVFVFNKHIRNPVKRKAVDLWKYLRHGI